MNRSARTEGTETPSSHKQSHSLNLNLPFFFMRQIAARQRFLEIPDNRGQGMFVTPYKYLLLRGKSKKGTLSLGDAANLQKTARRGKVPILGTF